MLTAAKRELKGDWLENNPWSSCQGDSADILRLARVQFDQGNTTSAAIICGVVLEKHLSNLCQAREIAIYNEIQGKAVPKKGLQLPGEAYKKKLYSRQDNKTIISWLEIYDAAAKEKHEALDSGQVKSMLNEMMAFLTKIKY